jgi:hypothetical protein
LAANSLPGGDTVYKIDRTRAAALMEAHDRDSWVHAGQKGFAWFVHLLFEALQQQ